MINIGRSKMLDSGFFENEVRGAIRKAWKGYKIAKNKGEDEKMENYARIIQESQYDLGLEVSSFDNIGRSAASFFWQIVQEVLDEEYQTDRCEQERFTDEYSESFQDDEKGDQSYFRASLL